MEKKEKEKTSFLTLWAQHARRFVAWDYCYPENNSVSRIRMVVGGWPLPSVGARGCKKKKKKAVHAALSTLFVRIADTETLRGIM